MSKPMNIGLEIGKKQILNIKKKQKKNGKKRIKTNIV